MKFGRDCQGVQSHALESLYHQFVSWMAMSTYRGER